LTGSARDRRTWLVTIGLYLVYIGAVLSPIWLSRVSPVWDGLDFNYPAFAFAADALHAGRLPLWDPYTNCGMPFHADPQYAWYQPAAMAMMFLRKNPLDGYMSYWALTYAWAGLGALFLAAALGARPLSALIAAVAFSLSGFFVGHGEHLPYLVTAAWVPWVFAFAHRAVARGSPADVLLCGAALGLSALGGYAGLVVFEGIALATWLALAFLIAADSRASYSKRLVWVAGTLGVSFLLLLVIWSPALYSFLIAARGYTSRVSPLEARDALFGDSFTLRAALSFLFPKLVVSFEDYFKGTDVTMNNAYLGALALPMAGFWIARSGKRAAWMVPFAALWFVITLGGELGPRKLLHDLIPATRYMHHNAMMRVLYLAPLAAAAGLGASAMLATEATRAWARITAFAWLLFTFVASVGVYALVHARGIGAGNVVLPPLFVVTAALLVLLWCRTDQRAPLAGVLIALIFAGDLAWHLKGNLHTMWRPRELLATRGLVPRVVDPAGPRFKDPDLRWSNVQQVIRVPMVEGFVPLLSDFNRVLVPSKFEAVLRLKRFWLSPSAQLAPPPEAGLPRLAAAGLPGAVPVFVDSAADALAGDAVEPGSFGSIAVLDYQPERVELEAKVPAGQAAILATTERAAPAWTVSVDGLEQHPLTVNYFFRGARVPPGVHRVVFEYNPKPFRSLLVLSYLTILASLVAAWLLSRRGSAATPAPP